MDEKNKAAELAKDLLNEVSGGAGKDEQDFGSGKIQCPECGTQNDVPMLVRPGQVIRCSNCGAQIKL